MSIRIEQSLRIGIQLSHRQKLELKQLLEIRQQLVTEPPPEAKTGLEGIGEAHKILQAKKFRGVLIGSLAADIWKTGDHESLARHKDVDVAIIPTTEEDVDMGTFEGGIDWWEPQRKKLDVKDDYGAIHGEFTWWENGNGAVIGVGLELEKKESRLLAPGLYIPTPEWLVNMRIQEILARTEESKVSDEALGSLQKRLEKELNPKRVVGSGVVPLTRFIPYRFQLGMEKLPPEAAVPLGLKQKSRRELTAIYSQRQSENQKGRKKKD